MEADSEGEMELLSSSIAAYVHIRDNLESVGLYFVLGVCFGLVLTLCLLVIHISWHPQAIPPKRRKSPQDLSEEEDERTRMRRKIQPTMYFPSPLSHDRAALGILQPPDGTLTINVFASAEELERAQRLEERERILREIWRNGQPDVLGTGTGTIGRVHYY